MGKVFRFHDGADLIDWQESNPLGDRAIGAIVDPDGGNASKEITSIPSPYARMDLVKNAFKEVFAYGKELKGKTIHHKMVSYALDLGQIFFNIDKYKDSINIIAWDPNFDLEKLTNSSDKQHKLLGESLRLFWKQDAESFGFDNVRRLYLLNYKKGENQHNIIGGTSPASLFFISANKFDLEGFVDGGHHFFKHDDYVPLYEREAAYVKYLYALRKIIPGFSQKMKSLDDYLDENFKYISLDLKDEIRLIDSSYYNALPNLSIEGTGNIVEIFGINLKKAEDNRKLIQKSQFVINPTKLLDEELPLVLPNDIFTESVTYVSNKWISINKAPSKDDKVLAERTLPFDGSQYPYLTISDFFEPVLVRTELPINTQYFVENNIDDKGYLIPIKPLFFNYFSAKDLEGFIGGQKRFEMKSLAAGAVEVILRIPIQDGKHIIYSRIYFETSLGREPEYNEKDNKGAIIESRLAMGITPFYKFPDGISAEYNVSFIEANFLPIFDGDVYELDFYDSANNKVEASKASQRRFKKELNFDNHNYIVKNNFDYLQVKDRFSNGIIIPKFLDIQSGTKKFVFAIDFGTTNTHIEFSENDSLPQPFEIKKNEPNHIGALNINTKEEPYAEIIFDDLFPDAIAENELNSFPQHTSIVHHNKIDFNKPVFGLANINIPFKLYKRAFTITDTVDTNLKWDIEDQYNSVKIKAYFEQLIKLIRNKILINSGDLSRTTIVWSYPASMQKYQLNILSNNWDTVITKILGDNVVIKKTCESITPFYYYKNVEGLTALVKPIVNIDIGGGTSDVVIFENNKPTLFTSYRFAGDAIFGDNYNRNKNINGFVEKYFQIILDKIEKNHDSLSKIIQTIKSENKSNDMINAMFSLAKNTDLVKEGIIIDFNQELQKDSEFKIIFLLFFTAQFYHVAQLMKSKKMDFPNKIFLSGTASQLLHILDPSKNKDNVVSLINTVFGEVYNSDRLPKIGIHIPSKPKEMASKGSLFISEIDEVDLSQIKNVLLTGKSQEVQHLADYSYKNIHLIESQTLENYKDFLNLFFALDGKISFKNTFGASIKSIQFAKEYLFENAENHLKVGIDEKLKAIGSDQNESIEETLFFYPLIGSIGELAYKIYESSN